jgi:hypothetical protein
MRRHHGEGDLFTRRIPLLRGERARRGGEAATLGLGERRLLLPGEALRIEVEERVPLQRGAEIDDR